MNDKQILTGLALVVIACFLLSNPRCNRGCKTLGQHILEHGLVDFLGGLLA